MVIVCVYYLHLHLPVVPLSAASSLALDDALNRLLSESMDSLNLPQKSQSAIAPAAVSSETCLLVLPCLSLCFLPFSLSHVAVCCREPSEHCQS